MLDICGLHRIQRAFLGCLVLGLGIGGCASMPPLPAPAERPPLSGMGEEPRQTPTLGYTLGPGDVLRVNVYDNPDLSQEVTIEADGAFSYPLIGRVQAAGLPVRQLESLLAKDRKSTRLNSSHSQISYAVFCLKKKKNKQNTRRSPLPPAAAACPAPRPRDHPRHLPREPHPAIASDP